MIGTVGAPARRQQPVLDVGMPFPGEQPEAMTDLATLDHLLASGVMPADHHVPYTQASVAQETIAGERRWYHISSAVSVLSGGTVGAALSIAFLATAAGAGAALPLGLAGAAVGGALMWLKTRLHSKGTVSIDNDGDVRKTKFFRSPEAWQKTPDEWRTQALAEDTLGDHIDAGTGALPRASSAKLAKVDSHRDTLLHLDDEHRLLADFGNRSRYGHDVLDLVDASTARKLIASGQPVYVANGDRPVDIRHQFTSRAKSPDKKVTGSEAYDFVERQFSYGLTAIHTADDLNSIEPGTGLPEGMVGVYKNSDTVSQLVYNRAQSGASHLEGQEVSNSLSTMESVSDASVERAADLNHRTLRVTEKYGFGPLGGLLGATVGVILGTTLLPAGMALLPIIACAYAGYKGTEKLVDRSMVRSQEKFQERQAAFRQEMDDLQARYQAGDVS